MPDTIQLPVEDYRLLVAIRYSNAAGAICEGLRRQCGVNDFHFLVTLRSFIEYTRRGIWFLVWATDAELRAAGELTFDRAGSPSLVHMDKMINHALGLGQVSHLLEPVSYTHLDVYKRQPRTLRNSLRGSGQAGQA